MTDHYDEMSVAPDTARAEALRQRLHARMTSAAPDSNEGQPRLRIGTARIAHQERIVPMKEIDVSDNSTNNDNRSGRRLAMAAAAAAVVVIAVTGVAFAINNTSDDGESPAPAASVVPTTTVPTTPAPAVGDHGALEGRWTTPAIPIEEIKATMLRAGVTQELVDQWVLEVGSPTEYTFSLEFHGDEFSHFGMTPQVARQVDESGTFVYSDDTDDLLLTIVDQGRTYTFSAFDTCCDDLKLRFVDSTDDGTPADKARHTSAAIALYTSALFHRRP